MANPFAKYAQPQGDPVIAVDPYKQNAEAREQAGQSRDDTRLSIEAARFDLAAEDARRVREKEAQTELDKQTKVGASKSSAVGELRRTIQAIDSAALLAGEDEGWFTTGTSGALVRSLPNVAQAGTDSRTLEGYLKTINANTALSKIMDMRANSPTGAGMGGATSDRDLELLQSSVASLDPDQDQTSFFGNLATTKRAYLDMLAKIDPDAAKELERSKGIRWDKNGSAILVANEGDVLTDERRDPLGVMGANGGGNTPAPPTVPGTSPGGGSLIDLAKQGVTLGLADEAAGVGGYISGFLTGEDPQAAYTRERDVARARVATARKDYPVLGAATEFLGGGAAARIAAPVGNALASVVRQGAALGGTAGYGYGEGAQGSVTNALAGAAGGAALGGALYGAGRGVSAVANRRGGPAPTAEQLALIQAGERQGVPVRQPDVRPELRNRMANAETTQTGGPLIREARTNDANLIEQRVAEVGGQGSPADPYALGTQVQEAGRRYIANTRTQANSLYDRARQAAGDARVQPTEALAAVDQNIAELRAAGENSNAGQIAYLEGLRQDLSNPLSIEAVQNLRTNMRGQLSERGLTGTDAERRVAQVIDAANQDLTRELPQGASNALRAAGTFYKERQGFINDTLNQIMGTRGNPLPAEQAASRLVSMTKGGGNYQRFSSMWKQLEPTEQADVAATVAESLGRKRNGEFSVSTLVQSLDPSKGINPRTARLIFGDDGAQALGDLRLLAKTKTDVQASLNNSRTGTAVNAATGGLKNLILSGLGFTTGGVGGAVAVPVAGRIISNLGEKRAARMLLNPDFTKWLKNAPNTTNPRVIDQYFSRLSGMNSVAANDNQAFVSAMREAFTKSPGAVAAQEPDGRREPPQ